jgi:Zn-dependent protease with chaperone function
MSWQLATPLLIVAPALIAAWFVPHFVSPVLALWVLVSSMVLAMLASVVLLLQIAAAGLSEIPFIADILGWCRAIYGGQHGATPLVGMIAIGALVAMAWRTRSYTREVRLSRENFTDVEGITIVDVEHPVAFAVPGNPGGVVISRSMLDALDKVERRVVLAHENAHLRYHHHAFVHAANSCAAAIPLLVPFARKVVFLTERWADETAAERVGSRGAVAAAIAKVALLPTYQAPSFAQALSGGDVIARYKALESPKRIPRRIMILAAVSMVVIAISATLLQFHQLADFATHSR